MTPPRVEVRVERGAIAIPFILAISGSALAAVVLALVHYYSIPIDNRIAALTMAGMVAAIQFLVSAELSRRLQVRTVLISQIANGLSWMAIVGVLIASHFLLPSVPKLSWQDLCVFGGLACVSAALSLLACYVAKLWQ